MSVIERFRLWRWKRHEDRLWDRHVKYTAETIAFLAKTNPTLASVTWAKVRAAVVDGEPPASVREGRDRLVAATDILLDALASEDRRLAR